VRAGWVFFEVAGAVIRCCATSVLGCSATPRCYIIFLRSSRGIVSTLIPVFAQRPLVGFAGIVNGDHRDGILSASGLWVCIHMVYRGDTASWRLAFLLGGPTCRWRYPRPPDICLLATYMDRRDFRLQCSGSSVF